MAALLVVDAHIAGLGTTIGDVITVNEVAEFALSLPEAQETQKWNHRTWTVTGKSFAWERPFSKADVKRFGALEPPAGRIVAITVADLGEKAAVIGAHPDSFFTIPHFDDYAAVLVQLDRVDPDELREAVVDGWLCCAPKALADEYIRRDT